MLLHDDVTPGMERDHVERKPFTLPRFKPLTLETFSGSKLDSSLKVCLAHLQLEAQERLLVRREEHESQLWKEMELKKLNAGTAFTMQSGAGHHLGG